MRNWLFPLILFCCSIASHNAFLEKTSNEIPIIFIHIGYSDYLEHSLWQALQYNKNVILISDDENNKHGLDVQYYDVTPFKKEADQFANEYVHLCTSPKFTKAIILSHLQRWFVLKEFMEHYNIPLCFQCDSDVMIYTNITDEVEKFEPCDLALVTGNAFHSTLRRSQSFKYFPRFSDNTVIIRKKLLDDYCNFLHEFYTDKNNINELIRLRALKRIPALVGGMFLITRYMEMTDTTKKFIIKNICKIKDDRVFDSFIHRSFNGQFERKKRVKVIEWINNKPYCYNKTLDKMIGFNTLHFAISAKHLMSDYKREKIE